MNQPHIDYVYDDDYLRWNLSAGHPTRPIRALNALRLIQATDLPHEVIKPRLATREELTLVHDRDYVEQTLAGCNDEWSGVQPVLGETAALMAGGTMRAVDRMLAGQTVRAFNPQGAKHHAQRANGSGFCVFNDMAMAAARFVKAGMRVLYVDWDAHHGDGVEALTADMPEVMTASIHNGNIYPGTGQVHDVERAVFNWPLPHRADGIELEAALREALDLALDHEPDVVLLAAGGDGHRYDPLGNLAFDVEDAYEAGRAVAEFADAYCEGRVLAGGAGGYNADDWTPLMWHAVVKALSE
jgi:acetoin utilization protein AcuC